MFNTKKINDESVKPVKIKSVDTSNIKGYDIIPEMYSNIYICAKKKSGKTSTLFKIIKECCDKNTHVIVFCSTYEKDGTWIAIKEWLEKHHIPSSFFNGIVNEEGDDQLEMLFHYLKNEKTLEQTSNETEQKKKEEDMKPKILNFTEDEEGLRVSVRKPKKISCKYFIVFDDISMELKNKYLIALLKENRHHKAKIIVSSQYIHDLKPEQIRQMDNILLFPAHSDDKLEYFHRLADLGIDFPLFCNMYKQATSEPYNFLYIDSKGKYRKNFDEEFII